MNAGLVVNDLKQLTDTAKIKKKIINLSINELNNYGSKVDKKTLSKEKKSLDFIENNFLTESSKNMKNFKNYNSNNANVNLNASNSQFFLNEEKNKSTNNNKLQLSTSGVKNNLLKFTNMKDFYIKSVLGNQNKNTNNPCSNVISPIKGRNSSSLTGVNISNKKPKNVTPNHRQGNYINTIQNSHSPFTTTNKFKSIIDNNKKKGSIDIKTDINSNKVTIKKVKPNDIKSNYNSKTKSPLNKTINTNTNSNYNTNNTIKKLYNSNSNNNSICNSNTLTIQKNSYHYNKSAEKNNNLKKLDQFKILLYELLGCEDSNIRESVSDEVNEAYKIFIDRKNRDSLKEKLNEIDCTFDRVRNDNVNIKESVHIKIHEFDDLQNKIKKMKKQIEENSNSKNDNGMCDNGGTTCSNLNLKNFKYLSKEIRQRNKITRKSEIILSPSLMNNLNNTKNSLAKSKNTLTQTQINFNNTINSNTNSRYNTPNKITMNSIDKSKFLNNRKQEELIDMPEENESKSNLNSLQNISQISLEQHYHNEIYINTKDNNKKMTKLDKNPNPRINGNDFHLNLNIYSNSRLKDNFIKDSGFVCKDVDTETTKPSSKNYTPALGLNLESLPKNNFNDEFMEMADEFSPSWREACKRINLVKKI